MPLEDYNNWLESRTIDEFTKGRLSTMSPNEIEDCFYKALSFGTGGVRGILGDGINRMNIYTVRQVTHGLAEYLIDLAGDSEKRVAIAYDSRNMSKEFALEVALSFTSKNIKALLFESIRSTPELSFAVRYYACHLGVVITASHNPKEYNGYKVYNHEGCQITDDSAKQITAKISEVDLLNCVNTLSVEAAVSKGLLAYIGKEVETSYLDHVKNLLRNGITDNISVVYTPLHGTGLKPIKGVFDALGFNGLHILESQSEPDGNFPTVISPNPEEYSALELALQYAEKIKADLVLGTDPDCDRVGVAVLENGKYHQLNGNQVGALLIYYMLNSNYSYGEGATVIKTIVTSDLGANIAKNAGLNVIETLTGFKYIGEKIEELEHQKNKCFMFGYEESYGYLAGTFVRDKDAVIASALIVEMASYFRKQNKSLVDVLNDIYDEFGYYTEKLETITLHGIRGQAEIESIMSTFKDLDRMKLAFNRLDRVEDFSKGRGYDIKHNTDYAIDLPSSNVIKFIFDNQSWFAVRPSGTEPKIKFYYSVNGIGKGDVNNQLNELISKVQDFLQG